MDLVEQFVASLRNVLDSDQGPYGLHEPVFRGREWGYVKDCLDRRWVSSVGGYVDQFEDRLAALAKTPGAVATVNGTAALHTSLLLAGVSPGDEILLPALTFVGTANAVVYCGAVPHFVDSEEVSLGVDVDKLSEYLCNITEWENKKLINRLTGRRIRALIVVHVFGHPVAMQEIHALCQEYGIKLIEDAAQALGSYYKGHHAGTLSDVAVLSFNGNKILTTGGGGAILSQDTLLLERARKLTTTARTIIDGEFCHEEVGYNYRMPNINAALGCAQLEQLNEYLSVKRRLAEAYADAFRPVDGVRFLLEPDYAKSNYWLNAVIVATSHRAMRSVLVQEAESAGFQCRPAWRLLHRLPMYADCPRMDLSCAEELQPRIINIPSSATLLK